MAGRRGLIQGNVTEGKGQAAALLHRVARIDGHVQQHVFHLVRVDQHMPQSHADKGFLENQFAQRAPYQFLHADEQMAEIGGQRAQRLAAGKRQQLQGQLGAPFDGGGGRIETAGRLRIAGHGQFQQLQIARDNLQHIIEVMRHATGQLADRFELLRLQQGLLAAQQGQARLFLVGHVAPDGMDQLLGRHGGPGDAAVFAVTTPVAVFHTQGGGAASQFCQVLQGGRAVVRMHQADEVHAQGIAFRAREDAGPGRIDGNDHAAQIGHQHDIGGQAPHAVALGRALHHAVFQRGMMAGQFFQPAPFDHVRDAAGRHAHAVDIGLGRVARHLGKLPQYAQHMATRAKHGRDPAGAIAMQHRFLAPGAPARLAHDIAAIHGRARKRRRAKGRRMRPVVIVPQGQLQVVRQAGGAQAAKAVGLVNERDAAMQLVATVIALQRQQQLRQRVFQDRTSRNRAKRPVFRVQQVKYVVCVHRIRKAEIEAGIYHGAKFLRMQYRTLFLKKATCKQVFAPWPPC